MAESLVLFESVINSRWFLRTSIILFMNKIDLFAAKLPKVPLEKFFSDYTGNQRFGGWLLRCADVLTMKWAAVLILIFLLILIAPRLQEDQILPRLPSISSGGLHRPTERVSKYTPSTFPIYEKIDILQGNVSVVLHEG